MALISRSSVSAPRGVIVARQQFTGVTTSSVLNTQYMTVDGFQLIADFGAPHGVKVTSSFALVPSDGGYGPRRYLARMSTLGEDGSGGNHSVYGVHFLITSNTRLSASNPNKLAHRWSVYCPTNGWGITQNNYVLSWGSMSLNSGGSPVTGFYIKSGSVSVQSVNVPLTQNTWYDFYVYANMTKSAADGIFEASIYRKSDGLNVGNLRFTGSTGSGSDSNFYSVASFNSSSAIYSIGGFTADSNNTAFFSHVGDIRVYTP